jgi:RimJ/RimL family protein N-acetyltransferase
MNVEPVTLEGRRVRLEPLTEAHADALWQAGADESVWALNPEPVHDLDGMRAYVAKALGEQARGVSLPFVTVEKETNQVVGSTRFGNIVTAHRVAEIGWTWINPAWQRTYVNTEAKYLMLRHAFETWGCNRVEFKTDSLNTRSRNAILRLGATEEGAFRNHIITSTGRLRHSVYFSIINTEWPDVKARLEERMADTWPV